MKGEKTNGQTGCPQHSVGGRTINGPHAVASFSSSFVASACRGIFTIAAVFSTPAMSLVVTTRQEGPFRQRGDE